MILLVYAHEPEIKPLKRRVGSSPFKHLVRFRRWRATDGAPFSIKDAPEAIINAGFAGRLNPRLEPGRVVASREFLAPGREPVIADRQLIEGFFAADGLDEVRLFTSGQPVVKGKLRDALFAETRADIVDTEAFPVAAAAQARKVPFTAIKVVSDNADERSRATVNAGAGRLAGRLAEVVMDFLGRYFSEMPDGGVETALSRIAAAGVKLNANYRRELAELIAEIAAREDLSCPEVLGSPEAAKALANIKLNGPQKLAAVKAALVRQRYPAYTAAMDRFNRQLKNLSLHPNLKVRPAPFFEEDKLSVEFSYRTPEELRKIIRSLDKLAKADLIGNAIETAPDNS